MKGAESVWIRGHPCLKKLFQPGIHRMNGDERKKQFQPRMNTELRITQSSLVTSLLVKDMGFKKYLHVFYVFLTSKGVQASY